jgi:hypothetical protein
MANLKVGKKFKLNGDTVQVVSINPDGTATLNYAAGSGKTGFAGKVALNVGSKSAAADAVDELDLDAIEVDDAVVTLDAYNDFEITNPVEKDSTDRMNAEEFAYFADHLGVDPDKYWAENKDEILAKRLEYADSMNNNRKASQDYKANAAEYDAVIFNDYQKDGKREFALGEGRTFTDSNDYSPKALQELGFTQEDFEHVNRPDANGKEASKELVEMRTSFLASSMAYENAVEELKNVKTPLFANDYDKYKPRFDAFYKAENAARRVRFYGEMTNRAEANGMSYTPTGSNQITIRPDNFNDWNIYRYADGGVPLLADLHEVKWARKVENEHYVFVTGQNKDLLNLKNTSDGSAKARKEAYQKYNKDFQADYVADEM